MACYREVDSLEHRDVEDRDLNEIRDHDIRDEQIHCYRCDREFYIVRVHPPVRHAVDPTETYTLECGHRVI
jgi:hypothetical protein